MRQRSFLLLLAVLSLNGLSCTDQPSPNRSPTVAPTDPAAAPALAQERSINELTPPATGPEAP